jgi:hypothetical protein
VLTGERRCDLQSRLNHFILQNSIFAVRAREPSTGTCRAETTAQNFSNHLPEKKED